ncbi:hypothetical protein Tco_0764387, partial [Tanacetum coccineum]
FGIESSDISSGDETLTDSTYENFKREKAYKAVPPPTGTIIPPRANVSFTGIDELAIRNKVNNQEKIKSSQPEIDRNKVIIEDWVDSDDEETVLNSSETQKKTVLNSENSETSFKNRSPSSQNSVGQGSRKKGLGNNGGLARSRVPQAVFSRSTDGSYYPRMDSRRPRISSYSPSSRSSTTRTPHRPQRPKKIVKSIWVKKGSTVGSQAVLPQTGNPEEDLKDYAIIDSGCSGSMTGDKDKLSDFKEFKGGYVAFGNDSKGGRISGKGTIKTSCLDFEKVSYVEELKKGKQHRASCKKIEERTVREPLELLHMDLFGPVSVECNRKRLHSKKVLQKERIRSHNEAAEHLSSASRDVLQQKEVKLSSEDKLYIMNFVSMMHQESLAKAHNDDQRIAFEEEKRKISIAKGKEHVDSTFTLSTANTPPQSTGNTPTDSDDDTTTDGFSTNSFGCRGRRVADYNNLRFYLMIVPSTHT